MTPNQIHGKKIAYACFDWGFGHVTRSISILNDLLLQGNSITFFGTEDQIRFVKSYFPQISSVLWEVPSLKFSGSGNFMQEGARNLLRIWWIWHLERKYLNNFARKNKLDFILSDHRYNFSLPEIPSIFITHQFNLPVKTPNWISRIHQRKLSAFKHIWIIDELPGGFAGDLSKGDDRCTYIGLQSRFKLYAKPKLNEGVLLVLSGPEVYARKLLEEIKDVITGDITVLAGFDRPNFISTAVHWIKQGEMKQQQLDELYSNTEWIVSRNGYSTRMDAVILEKKALLLATSGQMEQEYLCEIKSNPNLHSFANEKAFLQALKKLLNRNSSRCNNG